MSCVHTMFSRSLQISQIDPVTGVIFFSLLCSMASMITVLFIYSASADGHLG